MPGSERREVRAVLRWKLFAARARLYQLNRVEFSLDLSITDTDNESAADWGLWVLSNIVDNQAAWRVIISATRRALEDVCPSS